MKIKSKHILSYCPLCRTEIVKCITCGNNCCNGGYGEVNGEKCSDCPKAYDDQDLYWKDSNSIEFEIKETSKLLNFKATDTGILVIPFTKSS